MTNIIFRLHINLKLLAKHSNKNNLLRFKVTFDVTRLFTELAEVRSICVVMCVRKYEVKKGH